MVGTYIDRQLPADLACKRRWMTKPKCEKLPMMGPLKDAFCAARKVVVPAPQPSHITREDIYTDHIDPAGDEAWCATSTLDFDSAKQQLLEQGICK
mmetsp:Transcript_120707/g.269791  ORF Transcript_120707/g.269791 Transcript_120707/m.269791 type:complete len:96 (-) Transcript_120707:111-398(-)